MKNYESHYQGFTLDVTPEWIENNLESPFGVSFQSNDGAVVYVFSHAAKQSIEYDPKKRKEKIYQKLCADETGARPNWAAFQPIPGGINTASGQIFGQHGVQGLISILHRGIEYTIHYSIPFTSPYSAVKKVNDLVLSFRLTAFPDSELFINPQIIIKERIRWWHFWRWLGQ